MKQDGVHTALRCAEVSLARHVGCSLCVAPGGMAAGVHCVAAAAFVNGLAWTCIMCV
jgi:hypothetical protein